MWCLKFSDTFYICHNANFSDTTGYVIHSICMHIVAFNCMMFGKISKEQISRTC